ncbi:molybdenum cofactor biosynthesis protein MoaE [Corynebacterium glyciniphilum]|uniref:molybdenum cofactor biosynthesis protein MoaE n=1 Tax=Corynebacterium glyciniphilum TaxID=1404244 RepID=UPI00265215BE|nr:molybdenum cofactor biosynthesis protein MoaE [Corynebacterium glyciniphilum]MDN6705167.1 molybdenum cofactor biosynthesis protein MoaE [Corynebacterium glyciniphilum]
MNENTTDPGYVAEQTGVVVHTSVSDEPLETHLVDAKDATATDAMGAVVTFEGTVRNHDGGAGVTALTYSHHPTTPDVLARIAADTVAEYPDVRLWAEHRTGDLAIGDLAFLVVVAAAHRGPAFEAVAAFADAVKSQVPIWKEQELIDGSTEWVGL